MLDEKLLVFVLGAPGAGKGTQCDLIVKEYGWTHISAGDLLRAQVKAGTAVGKEAEEYLKQGTMVPASMIIGLLKDALCEAQHTKVLIDGFPRVLDQLKEFEKQVRPCNKALFFKIEEEAARARLMKRAETSGRVDDNEETIRNRFVVFKQESMPVITELKKEGRAVEVDASQPPEQVFAVTRRVIEELEQQQAQQAQTAAAAAAVAAEAAPASPTAAAVQSLKASTVLAADGLVPTSPLPAPASASGSTPASLHIPAAAAASTPTPASPQAAAVEVTPISPQQAAAAAPEALVLPSVADAHSTPAAAQATSPTALGAAAAAVAGTGAALAAAGAAAAVAAGSGASSPVKPDLHVGDEALAAEAETAAVAQASAASPRGLGSPTAAAGVPAAVAVPPAGVPAALDVTSPTATSQGPPTPSKAMIGSLQVDLSGIRTPVLICGPSGVGKGTLIAKLMEQHPDRFGFSVSHTTRGPRPGEVHGKHYYFTDRECMAAQVAAGMFLEHADVHGNMYGTSLAAVAQVSAAGKHCVLDIDVQGAAQVRKSALGPHCLFIFVAPPSHEELERRLRNRGTETEDKVLQRLANATSEIAKAQEPGLFHHVLVNADLETAHQDLLKLIAQRVPGLLPTSQQQADSSSQPMSEAGATGTISTPTAAAAAATPTAATPTAAAAAAAEVAQSHTAAAALPGAGTGAVLAGAAAVAAGGMAAVSAAQQQQQQSPLVNGNVSTAAASGGTAALLDFGFGASAGHASAPKGMPVRQYMDATVIPVLREGLKALNLARPDDPLQFLADYLVSHKAAAA